MCAPNRRLDAPGDSNKAIAGHQLRTAPTIVRASFGILLLAACTFSAYAQNLSLDIPAGTLSKALVALARSEEHTSELQSLMRISYAVLCLKNQIKTDKITH